MVVVGEGVSQGTVLMPLPLEQHQSCAGCKSSATTVARRAHPVSVSVMATLTISGGFRAAFPGKSW